MALSPETFEAELQRRLGPDHRLRWSAMTSQWCIEQKIGRGVWDLPVHMDSWDDSALRAREGYSLVCAVFPVPFIVCKDCHLAIPLPELVMGEVHCAYCEARTGEQVRYLGGYFPLCDALLSKLERTSGKRAKAWREEMNAKNAQIAIDRQRDWDREQDAAFGDIFNRAADRPQIGYGGSIKSTGTWTTT